MSCTRRWIPAHRAPVGEGLKALWCVRSGRSVATVDGNTRPEKPTHCTTSLEKNLMSSSGRVYLRTPQVFVGESGSVDLGVGMWRGGFCVFGMYRGYMEVGWGC